MTQVQRTTGERDLDTAPQPAPSYHYDAGGHVAMLQAKLDLQLRDYDSAGVATAMGSVERLTQFCSRTGGYAMLAMGYVIVGIVIAKWL
jgi:hypothetical protein